MSMHDLVIRQTARNVIRSLGYGPHLTEAQWANVARLTKLIYGMKQRIAARG